MTASDPRNAPRPGDPRPVRKQRSAVSDLLAQFEKRQNHLWRVTLFLLVVFAVVFSAVSWNTIRSVARSFEVLPVGLVILVVLFGLYAWKRTQEISELRGLVRGIEQREAAPPSDKQLDQLFDVISRSQQGYRDLIDSFDDVLLALTLDGQIRALNRSFSDLVGLPFQDIIGHHLGEFLDEISGAGRELVARAMPRFLERRQWTGIVHIRLKNQTSPLYFDCVAHAMLRDNQVHGITVLARDITALRRNEARFTELFETLQEGIYIITPDDRVLDANPALVRMLGYGSKEEFLTLHPSEFFADDDLRRSFLTEVDQKSVLIGREITLKRKDGSELICLNTAAAVRDASGQVVRFQGAVMDITERREMERRLYQQQEFARRLVDGFPNLILVVDTTESYTFVSPRVKEVLGLDIQEAYGMHFGDRVHPEDLPDLRSVVHQIIAGHQSLGSLEVRMRHKSGEWRRVRCHFSALFDESGKINGVIISGHDVTDLKRLEEQLIQSEKLAAMGQMLAGVAHELNNPLTAIVGVTELLCGRDGLEESTKRQLELTYRQARRAARIVQNLLEFSRPATPQKHPVDVNALIERTLQLHEHSLRRNNIVVDFQPVPALPPVIGDGNQLIQVLLNLVSNAEYAIRELRESGRIQIRVGRLGERISVTVQDDGVGILPDALPRLFDPFYTTKRPGGGTGLGLSICLAIVREHGGSIDVETLQAGGSAFTMYLPIGSEQHAPPLASDTTNLSPEITSSASASLQGRSVLVLDDEEGIRMLLAEGLSAHGLRVHCVATCQEAVDFARGHSCDFVLCDLHLSSAGPPGSGREAAQKIMAAMGARKPALIYMTGDLIQAGDPTLREARRLQKPFRISEVLSLLQEILLDVPAGKLHS